MRLLATSLLCALAPLSVWASFAGDVESMVVHGDLATADRAVQTVRAKGAAGPEVAAAISWLARGALAARQLDRADAYAAESRKMALASLGMRRLDSDPWLPTAVGAAIEVHAYVLAARGEIPEALAYLREQANAWNSTSIVERIHKNINLLSLEGKPAPPLEGVSLSALKGKPVLLFFWAHWCPDCKADVPILAAVEKKFASQGLTLIGPTRLYGYAAGGDPAPPAAEKQYIEQVREKFYAPLGKFPYPISAANFQSYGASTTPTIVLIDRAGIVRYYHPGAVTEAELSARVESILR
jgi:thiol-disulfide isomerase/thioredoxin